MNRTATIYRRYVAVRLSIIIFGVLVLALIVLGYMYWKGDVNTKLGSLIGGLVTTLIAVTFQFILTWNEHREVERMKRMGFLNILPNRADRRNYYASLLASADERIDFVGNTAKRFLDDFAYEATGASDDDQLLLSALRRNVTVRILLAPADQLDETNQKKRQKSQDKMIALKAEFPKYFNFQDLKTPPTQTFVRVDQTCVFGPVFPNVPSRVTPAIHADVASPYLKQYFAYFDHEWTKAGE